MPGYKTGRFIRGLLTQYRHKKILKRQPEQPLATYGLTDAISIFPDRVVVSTLTTTDVIPVRQVVSITVSPGLGEDWITLTCADEGWARSRKVWAAVEAGKAETASAVIRDLGNKEGMSIAIEHKARKSTWLLTLAILAGLAFGSAAVFLAPWGIYALPLLPISWLLLTQFMAARRRAWRPLTPSSRQFG